MRVARLVGLSPDGRFVIVATERGEELAIAADDRLRAALRGRPAASEKLEIEMESALSPREIQTRIRSGESVDDLARVAGMERDRVERFAAPVIAEREHVAGLAMGSSARRRGETSSHRTLRGVLTERLLSRGVDIGTVQWDSYRLDDGRWAVTADYRSGESPRQALFFFDLPGRYSVAGNDDGRWVLGDSSPSRGQQPPAPDEPDDTEPTLDLSDELALVRAIQDIPMAGASDAGPSGSERTSVVEGTEIELSDEEVRIAEVVQLTRLSGAGREAEADVDDDLAEVEAELDRLEAERSGSGLDALQEIFDDQDPSASTPEARASSAGEAVDPESAEPTIEVDRGLDAAGAEQGPVEDSAPSDASAVPELRVPLLSDAWEPAIVVDYPVEPSGEFEQGDGVEVPEGSDEPGRPEAPVARQDRADEADAAFALADGSLLEDEQLPAEPADTDESSDESPDTDESAPDEPARQPAATTDVEEPAQDQPDPQPTATGASALAGPEDQPLPLDLPEQPATTPPPKPARRKRASVPSWDEIVFGGPKDSQPS